LPAFITAEIPEFSAWLVMFTVCEITATGAPETSSAIRNAAGTGPTGTDEVHDGIVDKTGIKCKRTSIRFTTQSPRKKKVP
jgi:hypothetical protein